MASLAEIENAIKKLDPNLSLHGLSYGTTQNQSLGIPSTETIDSHFFSILPFGDFKNPTGLVPGFSGLERAFKLVLTAGVEEFKKVSAGGSKLPLFIDITHTEESGPAPFFLDGHPGNSVAQAVASAVNGVDHETEVIIRFLVGTNMDNFWEDERGRQQYEKLFWSSPELKITHPKAKLHVGYYSPHYQQIPGIPDKEQTKNWLADLAARMKGNWETSASKALSNIVGLMVFKLGFGSTLPSLYWNHGKILAVAGQTLLTGGGNYWENYTAKTHPVIDMQAKIKGDAAVTAHHYADYFWSFLNADLKPKPDEHSKTFSTSLNDVAPSWKPGPGEIAEKVALFHQKPTGKGGLKVLTAGRLGDWLPHFNKQQYPIQMIDLLRDLYTNFLWLQVERGEVKVVDFRNKVESLRDEVLTEALSIKDRSDFSPAVWASRYSRVYAIANAQKNIYVSNQAIVTTLPKDTRETLIGAVAELKWNGQIWPFDLLIAFAKFLIRVQNTPDAFIHIVLTSYTPATSNTEDWGDMVPVSTIVKRLELLIDGMEGAPKTTEGVKNLVAAKFLIRRVQPIHGADKLHSKSFCVDGKLLYVGSDNFYPSYNEEHGVWVEDPKTIGDWAREFWKNLWAHSTLAND